MKSEKPIKAKLGHVISVSVRDGKVKNRKGDIVDVVSVNPNRDGQYEVFDGERKMLVPKTSVTLLASGDEHEKD